MCNPLAFEKERKREGERGRKREGERESERERGREFSITVCERERGINRLRHREMPGGPGQMKCQKVKPY